MDFLRACILDGTRAGCFISKVMQCYEVSQLWGDLSTPAWSFVVGQNEMTFTCKFSNSLLCIFFLILCNVFFRLSGFRGQ